MSKQTNTRTPEEELEYLKDTVEQHIANYGEEHPITLDAKKALQKELESRIIKTELPS